MVFIIFPFCCIPDNCSCSALANSFGIFSASVRAKFGDAGEENRRLGFDREAKRSARIRFCLCGEIGDEERGFKEITLCMVVSWERQRVL